jgi:hypothetical protein
MTHNIAPQFPTYACRAEHQRLHPVHRSFPTFVPMVRVPLAERNTPDFTTSIGTVRADDHLLYSVSDVRREFGDELDRPIARVDLITPARRYGSRFSPIALFFGYEHADDETPSFFIVEAGTADGQPKVLYLARHMDEALLYFTGYHPSPLTMGNQIYHSRLTMDGDEPVELVVEASADPDTRPHLRILARFEREALEELPTPYASTAEAAVRVMTIGRAIGVDVAGAPGRFLGALGASRLAWNDEPPPSSRAA